jgi:hypothetical protein
VFTNPVHLGVKPAARTNDLCQSSAATLSRWWITIELINWDPYCEEQSAHFVEARDFFVDGSYDPVGRHRPKYFGGVIPFTSLRRRKHYPNQSEQGHEALVEVERGLMQSETAHFRHTGAGSTTGLLRPNCQEWMMPDQ